jgi:hypothetical protein
MIDFGQNGGLFSLIRCFAAIAKMQKHRLRRAFASVVWRPSSAFAVS